MRPFGFEGEQQDLAVTLSQILFPIVALLGVSGVIVGILNSYDQFSIPALTPVAWNLVIIVGLVVGVPQTDSDTTALYVYAGAILLGTRRPGAAPGAVALRPRRAAAARARLARPAWSSGCSC